MRHLDIDLQNWRRASSLVRRGRVIELGRVFHSNMPHYPTHPDFEVSLFRKHGERVRGDGASSASCHWSFGGHTGTHVDALCHVSQDGCMFDGAPVDNDLIERGEAPGDAAALAPHIARGVLMDVAAFNGVQTLPGDHAITAAELQATAQDQGITIGPGDIVLIRTGWGAYWGQEAYIGHETPGPNLDGATWLADQGAALMGSDTAVFEKGPVTDAAPVHHLLLIQRRIHIMENLALDELSEAGVHEFLFLSLPLRVNGATASPLRPVALC